MTKLGKYIDRILEEKKISLKDFCKNSNISVSYYYKIKNDKNLSITLAVATNIANGLQIHPEILFEEIGVIGIINEYLLTEEQALTFMKNNKEFINMCGIDSNSMTKAEINEYVNFIFKCMKMSSYKYL